MKTPTAVAKHLSTSTNPDNHPRLRLAFLDGLRGLMALYVVLFHAFYFARDLPMHPIVAFATGWLNHGHYAVDIFIVLSGFCLMLPVTRSRQGKLPNGFGTYIWQRARRILPPYYAALFFSIVLVGLGQWLQRTGNVAGTYVNDIFTPGIIISHLLLIHNLDFIWAVRINAPMWSVATEWQIYFLFPLLLLPLLRYLGHFLLIIIATIIGLLPLFLLPTDANLSWASPWFLGLFAMGMVGADSTFGTSAAAQRWGNLLGQWPVAAGAFLLVVTPILPSTTPIWVYDILVGIGTTSLIVYCLRKNTHRTEPHTNFILRVLDAPWAVELGMFSYSLYLIHNPIQQAALRVLQSYLPSTEMILAIQLLVGVPVIVGMAYLFHCVFERRFMNMPSARASQPRIWQSLEPVVDTR